MNLFKNKIKYLVEYIDFQCLVNLSYRSNILELFLDEAEVEGTLPLCFLRTEPFYVLIQLSK